jgi:hypothetical protein
MPNGAPVEVLSVDRVGQLTGSHDPEGWVLLNGDTSLWGVAGVDLGCNTEHEGRLFIFSGDVVPGVRADGPRRDADFVGWTDATDIVASPGGGFALTLQRTARPDAMTVIEIRPHPWGWKVFEAPGVEPVFQAKAIGVLQFTASQLLPSGATIRRGSRESQARRQS